MPQGLQVWDAAGQIDLDTSKPVTKLVGSAEFFQEYVEPYTLPVSIQSNEQAFTVVYNFSNRVVVAEVVAQGGGFALRVYTNYSATGAQAFSGSYLVLYGVIS